MSFSFEFEVTAEGEIYQNEHQKANLKNQVASGIVPVDQKILINGHKEQDGADWGRSVGVFIENFGQASATLYFPKPSTE